MCCKMFKIKLVIYCEPEYPIIKRNDNFIRDFDCFH
jgi:hypothetical protein